MTIVVNLRNGEEEKVLLAFLNSLEYEYQTGSSTIELTEEQAKEILRREQSFVDGKTTVLAWDEISSEY